MLATTDFGALRAFIAVAEALSFNQAAETLGVTSSALSQTIRGLEERVGARLLNRTTRSVSLTDAGGALLAQTRPAMDQLSAAFDYTRNVSGSVSGTVRVHAFRIAADLFIAPMLATFAKRFPDVTVDITLDDEVVDIVATGFDVGLRLGELIEQDMIAVPIGGEIRQLAVASPAYLALHGAPARPQDLLNHLCIRWRWPGRIKPYAWEFCENGRWFSINVNGPLIANGRAFGVEAAVNGVGIAFAAEATAAPFIRNGTLIPLLQHWSAPIQGFYLCYPQQRQMAPALRAFVNALRETAEA